MVTGSALVPVGSVLQSRRSRARCSPLPPTIVAMTMALRQPTQARSQTTLPPQWAAATLHAAGMDVGAAAHYGAVPPRDDPPPVRGLAASTAALAALAAWWVAGALTTVAMASPGVSWLPLLALLEARGCEVRWVDPQHVQQSKGRPKRDGHACPWMPRRHPFGLLASAFRPTDQIGVLRSYLRQRAMLLTSAGHTASLGKRRSRRCTSRCRPSSATSPG